MDNGNIPNANGKNLILDPESGLYYQTVKLLLDALNLIRDTDS